jgi:hypothetical protein
MPCHPNTEALPCDRDLGTSPAGEAIGTTARPFFFPDAWILVGRALPIVGGLINSQASMNDKLAWSHAVARRVVCARRG